MRLLIVEDEKDIADPLKKALESNSFVVDHADDGKKGLNMAQIHPYDCILLDINLPEIDGIELAQKLRQQQDTTPIIMVTARSQTYDKVEGFESGADDYITKPFEIVELIARIKALIKRNSINKLDILEFSNMKLIPKMNKIITKNDEEIELSNKETSVLEYLLRNKAKIVSAEELLDHVWGNEVDIFSDTVKTHIKTLRKKIDPDKKIIKTVRGKGYVIE